jgi:hypothetical protein
MDSTQLLASSVIVGGLPLRGRSFNAFNGPKISALSIILSTIGLLVFIFLAISVIRLPSL